MRTVSAQWAATIARDHQIVCSVRAEYNGEFTREVPLLAGQITYDATARGRRRCTFSVPLYGPDGFRWDPGENPLHPLATFGQRVQIYLGVIHPAGSQEILLVGSYLITSTATDEGEGVVMVTGSDLMLLMQESKILLVADSVVPLPADTHLTALTKLTWAALHSPTLDDRQILPVDTDPLPVFTIGGTTIVRDGQDRLEAIQPILDSWPAQMYVDDLGKLHFAQPVTGPKAVPDIIIRDATPAATLIGQGRQQDRRRSRNSIRVTGLSSSDGTQAGTALAFVESGVLGVRGPYGWITEWHNSAYVQSNAQALAVAQSLLARGTLYTRTERVLCAPDPAIELNDTAQVISATAGTFTGIIAAITIPMTAAGGPMSLDVTTHIEEN